MMVDPPVALPLRPVDAHKGSFGSALLIGGSRGMSGSIAMSAIAALHSGAGLVTAAVPDRCLETVAQFHPAIMTAPLADDSDGRFAIQAATQLSSHIDRATAIGVGPGMTTEAGTVRIVERLLSTKQLPRVFDADAINAIAMYNLLDERSSNGPIVLTPHPGELQRLTGVGSSDRQGQIEIARDFAEQHGVTVVVKGGPTVVIGDGQTWTNTTGNPGMATAGSGDVLTGVLTALLAQGLSAFDAARLGVWMHGRAGDIATARYGQPGVTATRILECIGRTK